MASTEPADARVAPFPLVGPHDTEADALVAIIRRLAAATSLAEIMDVVTHAARTLLQADGITFVLRDGDLCHYAEEDAISPLWKGQRFPMSACISGWVMQHGQAVAIPDIFQDPRIPQDAYRPTFVRSLAMAPVRQEEPIAALGAYWSMVRSPTAAELERLQTLANAAALAVSFVQLRQQRRSGWSAATAFLRRMEAAGPQPAAPATSRLTDWLVRRPVGGVRALSAGIAFSLAAWGLRALMQPLVGAGVPYTLFLGAVLLAALKGGRVGGLAATAVGGVLGHLTFVSGGALTLAPAGLWSLLTFVLISVLVTEVVEAMTGALRREAVLNGRLEMVGRELQHRIRNVIAVAQALARQTGRATTDVKEFERKLGERLHALGSAQVLLSKSAAQTADLEALVEQVLEPFGAGSRIDLEPGQPVELDEQLAVAVALLLNELATNAIKYGALSGAQGRVRIAWSPGDRGGARLLWAEQGGPPVTPPERAGFGTRLLQAALPRGRGVVRLHYDPAGVRCEIELAR